MSKHLLFYESAEDVLATAPRHFAAHRARYESFRDTGQLLLIGTFADARRDGAMAIFATREAASSSTANLERHGKGWEGLPEGVGGDGGWPALPVDEAPRGLELVPGSLARMAARNSLRRHAHSGSCGLAGLTLLG